MPFTVKDTFDMEGASITAAWAFAGGGWVCAVAGTTVVAATEALVAISTSRLEKWRSRDFRISSAHSFYRQNAAQTVHLVFGRACPSTERCRPQTSCRGELNQVGGGLNCSSCRSSRLTHHSTARCNMCEHMRETAPGTRPSGFGTAKRLMSLVASGCDRPHRPSRTHLGRVPKRIRW